MRGYLTPHEYEAMRAAQGGACAICREPATRFIADHSTPNVWVPGKPDQLICEPCNHVKTYGTPATSYGSDIHSIAKVKRLRGETRGRPKRAWPKRKLQSRGFESRRES